MGLFDGLKRDKKAAETVKQHKKEEIVEDELIIDHIEVVERETVKPLVEQEVPPTPIKTIKDKAPVKHVVGQTKVMAIINRRAALENPRLRSTFPPHWESWASKFCWSILIRRATPRVV